MRGICATIVFCLIFQVFTFTTKDGPCAPDDEFENNITTDIWDEFMDILTNKTFFQNYTKICNSSQSITIDYTSQIIWNLRFTIYMKGLDENDRTLEKCYSENEIEKDNKIACDVNGFKNCMKEVRVSMRNDVNNLWDSKIYDKLEELC